MAIGFRNERYRELGQNHPQALGADVLVGIVSKRLNRFDEAETQLRNALDRGRQLFGDDHDHVLWAMYNLGEVLMGQGRHAEAVVILEDLVQRYTRLNGKDYRHTVNSRNLLEAALSKARRESARAITIRYPSVSAGLRPRFVRAV